MFQELTLTQPCDHQKYNLKETCAHHRDDFSPPVLSSIALYKIPTTTIPVMILSYLSAFVKAEQAEKNRHNGSES